MMNQFAPEDDVAFRIALADGDIPPNTPSNDFEALADTILETASVLPNTRVDSDQYGHTVVIVSRGDDHRWSHIVDRLRRLVTTYERRCQRRDRASGAPS